MNRMHGHALTRVVRVSIWPVLVGVLTPAVLGAQAPIPRVRAGVMDASADFLYAPPESIGLDRRSLDALADSVATWTAGGYLNGAELLIIKDGRTVLHEAVGWRDRESAQPLALNSLYRIRSMTKPFIGSAILMLQDEGRISVDDRVSQYLPAFDNERSRSIRIRELLTHTSGFGDHGSEDIGLPRAPDQYESLEGLVNDIGAIGPQHPRGEYRYSDSGSATLAAIVSAVAGLPVEKFLEERIFGPLGMVDTHTHFAPDSTWAARLSSTYQWSAQNEELERYWDPSQPQHFRYFRGSGGVYSTPVDYARFLSMWVMKGIYSRGRLLSDSAVESALRPEKGRYYGYQWSIPNAPALNGIAPAFFHGGSDGTIAFAIPEPNTLILFFSQARGGPVRGWLQAALSRTPTLAAYLPSEYQRGTMHTDELPRPVPLPAADLVHYDGRYVGQILEDGSTPAVRVWEHAGQLEARMESGRLHSPPYDLIHMGDNRFRRGRLVDGAVVEYLSEGSFMEFLMPASDGQFGQLRIGGRLLTREGR